MSAVRSQFSLSISLHDCRHHPIVHFECVQDCRHHPIVHFECVSLICCYICVWQNVKLSQYSVFPSPYSTFPFLSFQHQNCLQHCFPVAMKIGSFPPSPPPPPACLWLQRPPPMCILSVWAWPAVMSMCEEIYNCLSRCFPFSLPPTPPFPLSPFDIKTATAFLSLWKYCSGPPHLCLSMTAEATPIVHFECVSLICCYICVCGRGGGGCKIVSAVHFPFSLPPTPLFPLSLLTSKLPPTLLSYHYDLFVGWLLNVPATGYCISGTDLHRQFYVLPHWDRRCRSNVQPHPVTVYWHRSDQSQRWPYNARRLAG